MNMLHRLGVLAVMIAIAGCDSNSDSIAEVNGQSVTQAQFDAYLKFKRVPTQNTQLVNRELDDYLEREGLAGQIEEQKLLPAEQVEAEVAEFRKQMLIGRYFEEFLKERVTDEAVRNYYATNPDQFQAKKIHVAHILVRTNPGLSETERQALLTKASAIPRPIPRKTSRRWPRSTRKTSSLPSTAATSVGCRKVQSIRPSAPASSA